MSDKIYVIVGEDYNKKIGEIMAYNVLYACEDFEDAKQKCLELKEKSGWQEIYIEAIEFKRRKK